MSLDVGAEGSEGGPLDRSALAMAGVRPLTCPRQTTARTQGRTPGAPFSLRSAAVAGTLTWLGHASFRIETPGGKRVYIDPFLTGNPKCPEAEQTPERVDVIAVTHGHDDHVGDTIELAKKHSCPVIALLE